MAKFDTLKDATTLACLILDLKPEIPLESLFRPLENSRLGEMILSKEKAEERGPRPAKKNWPNPVA